MRLLIVDLSDGTGAEDLSALQDMCAGHELTVVTEGLPENDAAKFDAVILAGNYGHDIGLVGADQAAVKELVGSGAPVLGICRGFELVCAAFGETLGDVYELDAGAEKIYPTEEGAKLFQGSDPLRVNATRRWCADELPKALAKLATSESGIEAIRHKKLPVFALQFFPGDFAYPSDAKLVFQNLLSALGSKR